MIAPEVGGGFGCKLNVYRERALTAYLAIALGKPIKWYSSAVVKILPPRHTDAT